MKKLTIKEIVRACRGIYTGDEAFLDSAVSSVETDSRVAKPEFLFIPIVGEKFDGHDYIDKAFENGAICTLSEKEIMDRPHIIVKSTFQALKDIAEYYRSLFEVKVIAITGSVGKTTTKEMLYSVLSQKYNVLKSEKNYNNEIGVPHTLFNLNADHEIAVIEMGMNHAGEISRLSKTARPDICIIVNIDYSHVGYLGSLDGVFKAKSEIFDYAKPNCKTYLNGDDVKLYSLKDSEREISYYGFDGHNEILADNIDPKGFSGTDFILKTEDDKIDIHINKPGNHLIYAALVAGALGKQFGLSDEQIQKGILEFTPVDKRLDIVKTGNITILNDVYNASPKSVKAAIDVLCYAKGRKVCVLGDMGELGDFATKMHEEIGVYAAKSCVDLVICAGALSSSTAKGVVGSGKKAMWYETQEEMINNIHQFIKKGDTILIKASRSMHFENTVEALKSY